jgi:phage regulator Rha-like protein
MPAAATLNQLGFRVIEGGRSGKLAILKSPAIAEIFGVRHDHVLRDIRTSQKELRSPNLGNAFSDHCRDSTYRAADNNDHPCFELTKVGFSFVAAKYDSRLRFLLALAFDALEHDDEIVGMAVARQVNERIRELRKRVTGQNELLFDAPAPAPPAPVVVPIKPPAVIDDADDATANALWKREGATPIPIRDGSFTLSRWKDAGYHIRLRIDKDGRPFQLWVTQQDSIESTLTIMLVNPNGNGQVRLNMRDPFPPIDVIERAYDRLGPGPYAPIAKATVRHALA